MCLASQTAVMLRIDLIHTSMEAEQKWVSPHVEVKVKSRLASHTFPLRGEGGGGGGIKTGTSSVVQGDFYLCLTESHFTW